jgi:hypothetical protein
MPGTPEVDKKRIIFLVDGEIPQMDALEESNDLLKEFNIKVIKPAAASTATQQPNDVMSCFRTFKQWIKGVTYKWYSDFKLTMKGIQEPFTDAYILHNKPYMEILPLVLNQNTKELKWQEKFLLLKFFYEGPDTFSKCFAARSIKGGYKETGVYPIQRKEDT